MKNPKLNLTDEQDMRLREALDQLKLAKDYVAIAYKRMIFAADQEDNANQSRKLANHAGALDSIQSDLRKSINAITERIAGIE